MDGGVQGAWSAESRDSTASTCQFADVVFTPKPVQRPIPIWVGGESAPALAPHRALCRLLVSGRHQPAVPDEHGQPLQGRPQPFPRLRGEGRPRSLALVALALRVLIGPSARPRRTIDGEGEMFTGGAADYVADIKALADLGVAPSMCG